MAEDKIKLAELLKNRGLITDFQILYALQEQKVTRDKIGEILEKNGFVTEHDVARSVAEQSGIDYIDVNDVAPEPEALRLYNRNLCLTHEFLPIRRNGKTVEAVTSNSDYTNLRRVLSRHQSLKPELKQGERNKIRRAVEHYYYFLENPIEELLEREIAEATADEEAVRTLDSLLMNLFRLAVKHRATDVHVRPMERSISIAFRVDGIMRPVLSLAPSLKRLISTIKMRGNMDIAETRLPQDGSFSYSILNNEYDVRISTTICSHGENVVMRILPKHSGAMGISELGFLDEGEALLRKMFMHPSGMVLLTGPTGSGKTTTMYAGVRSMDLLAKNVLTVENPIEYNIPMLRQTEVNEKAGYTFASAIRHFLRHDPDVILVGEIRDQETAQTAVTAAETGHLVLTTLHTNDSFGVIPRLDSLGIPHHMIAEALVGAVSQRLIRRICEDCKESYTPDAEELQYMRGHDIKVAHRGRGCNKCYNTGYYSRVPIYEMLTISPAISSAIARRDNMDKIKEIARDEGFVDLFSSAVGRVKSGVSSIKEVVRVLGVD